MAANQWFRGGFPFFLNVDRGSYCVILFLPTVVDGVCGTACIRVHRALRHKEPHPALTLRERAFQALKNRVHRRVVDPRNRLG